MERMKRGKTNQNESEHKGEMHYIYLLLLDKGTEHGSDSSNQIHTYTLCTYLFR